MYLEARLRGKIKSWCLVGLLRNAIGLSMLDRRYSIPAGKSGRVTSVFDTEHAPRYIIGPTIQERNMRKTYLVHTSTMIPNFNSVRRIFTEEALIGE